MIHYTKSAPNRPDRSPARLGVYGLAGHLFKLYAMTKEDFIRKIAGQFTFLIDGEKRAAEDAINGERKRLDTAGFMDWLKREQDAANREPMKKVFDSVLRSSMGTPEDAAGEIADFIEFDYVNTKLAQEYGAEFGQHLSRYKEIAAEIDWREIWQKAAPFVSNYEAGQDKDWRYAGNFSQYLRVVKAEARAVIFSKWIEQTLDKEKFIRFLESTLAQVPVNIGAQIETEFSEKRRQSTGAGFLEYLRGEEQRLLRLPEIVGIAGIGDLTPGKVAIVIAAEHDKPGADWNAIFADVLKAPHYLITAFHDQTTAQVRLWKVRKTLEVEQPTQGAPANKSQRRKMDPFDPSELPALHEVVKDADTFLPKLWEALAGINPPAFDTKGNFIYEGGKGKDAVLYALSVALTSRDKLAIKADAIEIYLILCKHFRRNPAKRPDKLKNGKRVYSEYFDSFGLEIGSL